MIYLNYIIWFLTIFDRVVSLVSGEDSLSMERGGSLSPLDVSFDKVNGCDHC